MGTFIISHSVLATQYVLLFPALLTTYLMVAVYLITLLSGAGLKRGEREGVLRGSVYKTCKRHEGPMEQQHLYS